jgi:hypothetical protein
VPERPVTLHEADAVPVRQPPEPVAEAAEEPAEPAAGTAPAAGTGGEPDGAAAGPGGEPAAGGEAAGRPWRRAVVSALVAFVASHLAILIVNLLNWRAGRLPQPGIRNLLAVWQSWDTGHYLRIAEHGYHVKELDKAFFPLYPILIRAANHVLPGGYPFAALVVSNVACFAALVVLHRLAAHEFDEPTARRTVYYLVAFPTAFFLTAAYNESLYLALGIGALYAARRGHWWLAGGLAAFASGTRSVGVLLLFPFVYEYLRQRGFQWRRIRFDALAIGLVPAGMAAFAVYCWVSFGDPLAFVHAQKFWYRSFAFPWESLYRTLYHATREPALAEFSIVNFMDFCAGFGFLVLMTLSLVGPWRLRRDQWYLAAYGFAALMYPLFSPAGDERPLISMTRHVLEVVPAFLILGRMGRNQYFDRIYPMPAIALQCMLLLVFLHYDWAG